MAYMSPNGEVYEALNERNIEFIPLKDFSKKEISKGIKDYKPDIIHAHDVRATIQSVRCTDKNTPVISHIHGNHMKKLNLKSFIYLLYSFRVQHIIAVSDSVIDEYAFSRLIRTKCNVMYNIVNEDKIREKVLSDENEYNFDFVFLGRLDYPKDPERVAMVSSKVLKQLPNARFGIIGDGVFRKKMEDIYSSEGVANNVFFCGYMKNPYKALSQAKAMLMCSRYEGIPIAALEAMVLGVPIISTPVDGMKKIIINEINGCISSNDDDLANYVSKAITNKDFNIELSTEAKKDVLKFSEIDNYKEKLEEIYRKSCL